MTIASSRALLIGAAVTGASLSLLPTATAAAEPATVRRVGGGVVYSAAAGVTENRVEIFTDATGDMTVVDPTGLRPSGDCFGVISTPSTPITAHCGVGVPSVDASLGGGNDVITRPWPSPSSLSAARATTPCERA
jgi:hypothetical protein